MDKLCVVMYVAGERYADYIPLFLYFMDKSYPEYFSIICYKTELPQRIKTDLELLDQEHFLIKEHIFEDYPEVDQIIKSLRWILCLPEFEQFDYIFFGDIDILMIREEPTLLEEHKRILETVSVPFTNTTGIDFGRQVTGLHFVERKSYFEKMNSTIGKYKTVLKTTIPVFPRGSKNQCFLLKMLEEAGFDMPNHHFFDYHGLHLGHSRVEGRWDYFFRDGAPIAEGIHRDYFREFCRLTINPIFWKFYSHTNSEIQNEINIMIESGERNVKIKCGSII